MASDAPPPAQMSWLEQQFANTNIVILIIFSVCCSGLAAILAAVTYFTGTDPKAKQNALIVMIIGAICALGGGPLICCGSGMGNLFQQK
jgi:hypothetical protein